MLIRPTGLGIKNGYAGEDQQESTRPTERDELTYRPI
jgi:hypothetical protein